MKLGYAAVNMQNTYLSKEVVLICRCFVEIYKCSPTNRLRSFRHIGATELLPLLTQLWTNIMQNTAVPGNRCREVDDGIVAIARLLRVFSKMVPAKSFLIKYLKGTFIGKTLRDVLLWIKKPSISVLSSSTEVLWEILGLLKDLTSRSRTDDKIVLLRLEEGILSQIISFCFENIRDFQPRFQEWCTSLTWNLVLDPPICQTLLSKMTSANNKLGIVIVEGLLQALIQHSAHGKNSSLSLKIKRNAVSSLGNIFSDTMNHAVLFRNSCNPKLSALIPQLACSVQQDFDPVVRRRAMRTLRCIAGSTVVEAKNLIQKGNLSSFLIDIISRKRVQEDENDHDMLVQACQTIIALKESIVSAEWSQIQIALLQLLQNTTNTEVVPAAALCLSICVKQNHVDPNSSCFSVQFWNNIERCVSASETVHTDISELLIVLALIEKELGTTDARDHENVSVLTKTQVINALTTILLESQSTEQTRNQALEVVKILSLNENNKRLLAGNDRLLSGLVTVCLMQPDSEIKDSAKKIILQLVPEI